MKNTIDKIKKSIRSFRPAEDLSLWRHLEQLAWGQPLWLQLSAIYEARAELIEDSLDKKISVDDLNNMQSKADRVWSRAKYGRPTTEKMLERLNRLNEKGLELPDQRDGVIGRILIEDGSLSLEAWRKHTVLLLGIFWHIIAATVAILLTALIIALPLPVILSVLITVAFLVFIIFSHAFINALTIRTFLAWDRFKKLDLITRDPPQAPMGLV